MENVGPVMLSILGFFPHFSVKTILYWQRHLNQIHIPHHNHHQSAITVGSWIPRLPSSKFFTTGQDWGINSSGKHIFIKLPKTNILVGIASINAKSFFHCSGFGGSEIGSVNFKCQGWSIVYHPSHIRVDAAGTFMRALYISETITCWSITTSIKRSFIFVTGMLFYLLLSHVPRYFQSGG